MKDLRSFDQYRVFNLQDLFDLANGRLDFRVDGGFIFQREKGRYFVRGLKVFGWEHISMAVFVDINGEEVERIPGTSELEEVKQMFFSGEPVIEVHPKKEDYVNIDPYMLHLWRPMDRELPLPPVVSEFIAEDIIQLPRPELSLLVKTARSSEGWECYEVGVLRDGKILRRKPSWDEMCIAKKTICGEDIVALQYHIDNDGTGAYSTRLWVPPKTLDMPLPEPFLVGIRNEEDMKALKLKSQREDHKSTLI